MPKPRIKIRWDQFNGYTFHTTVLVSTWANSDFFRPLHEGSEVHLKRIGEVGQVIVRRLMDIPGVTSVRIQPYLVKVNIGAAFDWEEIRPLVIEIILQEAYHEDADQVEIIDETSPVQAQEPEENEKAVE